MHSPVFVQTPECTMWDLIFVLLSVSSASALNLGQGPAVGLSLPEPEPAHVRGDATDHRMMLPKAARRALRRGHAELFTEGERRIVRPTDTWLAADESRTGHLDVSEDAGRIWRRVELPPCGNAGCVLRLEKGGALQMMTGFEAGCGGGYQTRMVGHLDGREWQEAPWSWDSPLRFSLPADGWAAGECSPAETLKDTWKGPDSAVCLIDLAGHEVYLPVEWAAEKE